MARLSAPWRRDPFDREASSLRLVDRAHDLAALPSGPASDRDVLYLDTDARCATGAAGDRDGLRGRDDPDGREARSSTWQHDRASRKPRKGSGAGVRQAASRARRSGTAQQR